MFKRFDTLFLFLLLTLGVDIFYYHCLYCNISGIYRSPFATIYVIVILCTILPSISVSKINLNISLNLSVFTFIALGIYSLNNFLIGLHNASIHYYSLLLILFLFYIIFYRLSKNHVNRSFISFVTIIFSCLLICLLLILSSSDLSNTVHPFRGLLGLYADGNYFRQKGLFSSPGELSLCSGLIILYCLTKSPPKGHLIYFVLAICAFLFWISDTRSAHVALFMTLALVTIGRFINKAAIGKTIIAFLCIEFIYFIQLGLDGLMNGADARFAIYTNSLNSIVSSMQNPSELITNNSLSLAGHSHNLLQNPSELITNNSLSLAGHSHNLLLDILNSDSVIAVVFGLLSYFAIVGVAFISYKNKKYLTFSIIFFLLIFSQFDLALVMDRLTITMGFLLMAILTYGVRDKDDGNYATLANQEVEITHDS